MAVRAAVLAVVALSACAPRPPSPDVGCTLYGEHRGGYSDADFLAAPDGLQAWVLKLDAVMTAGCRVRRQS